MKKQPKMGVNHASSHAGTKPKAKSAMPMMPMPAPKPKPSARPAATGKRSARSKGGY